MSTTDPRDTERDAIVEWLRQRAAIRSAHADRFDVDDERRLWLALKSGETAACADAVAAGAHRGAP